jgi:hypothetical protein
MARIRKSGPKNARRPFQPATEEMKTGEQIAEALEHIAVALSAIDHNLEILAQHVIKITSPRNGAQTAVRQVNDSAKAADAETKSTR